MLTEVIQFFREFNWSFETTTALVVGFVGGVMALAGLRKFSKKYLGNKRNERTFEKELQEEQGKCKLLKELVGDRDLRIQQVKIALREQAEQIQRRDVRRAELEAERDQLAAARNHFQQLNDQHRANVLKANERIRLLKGHVKTLRVLRQADADHIQTIVDLEGRFWEQPPNGHTPAFRPLDKGKPPIVALVNLKGGVGKTTLTANLGATLWSRKLRTMLVDLDNQGSLSALCLAAAQLQDVERGGGKYVHRLLQTEAPDGAMAWSNLTAIGDTEGRLLAATEALADVEEHAKASWLLKPETRDVRYDLRSALHDPLIQDRFDAILLDCPPRLSTACINALTCCDYVLIPVLLDKTSADAVPRLLKWLRILKSRGVCPDLKVLGVLANRTFAVTKLSKREANLWSGLGDKCRTAWGEDVPLCDRWIPDKTRFAEAAESRKLAALDDELAPIFKDLVAELKVFKKAKAVAAS